MSHSKTTINDAIRTRIDAYEIHPLYPTNQDLLKDSGDIALVHFSGGLLPGYKPVKLLENASVLRNGAMALVTGYGIDDATEGTGSGRLRWTTVTIADAAYSQSEILIDQRRGQGVCHGDSGGPVYLEVAGEPLLFGNTNQTINDDDDTCAQFVSFASIPHYLPWIATTAQKLNATYPLRPLRRFLTR